MPHQFSQKSNKFDFKKKCFFSLLGPGGSLHTWDVTPGNKHPKISQNSHLNGVKTTHMLPNAADL